MTVSSAQRNSAITTGLNIKSLCANKYIQCPKMTDPYRRQTKKNNKISTKFNRDLISFWCFSIRQKNPVKGVIKQGENNGTSGE